MCGGPAADDRFGNRGRVAALTGPRVFVTNLPMTHSLGSCRVTSRIGALLLFALIAFTTSTAFAHARLVKSDPKDKAELSESPKQVELWFRTA